MYDEASKSERESASVLITTADEDNQKQQLAAEKVAIDSAINVILHVKKIKRDLHIQ